MDIKYNTDGLEKLKKAFAGRSYVKVGVLSEGATRNNDYLLARYNKFKNDESIPESIREGLLRTYQENPSNADVGAALEFGVVSKKVPARPWLMTSVTSSITNIIKQDKKIIELMAKRGKKDDSLQIIGAIVEDKIQEAFETEGDGKWPGLSPITIKLKGSSAIGIDTAQLRKSVSSQVVSQ